MIIHVKRDAKESEIQDLSTAIEEAGFRVHRSDGERRTIIGLIGDTAKVSENDFKKYSIVDGVYRIQSHTKANRSFKEDSVMILEMELKSAATSWFVGPHQLKI